VKKVILDEGVPRSLARHLRDLGIDAAAFPNGMKQLSNGRLLAEVERRGFNVLLTNDKSMQFQQNLRGRPLAIVSLPTNLRPALMKMLPQIAEAIKQAEIGHFTQLHDPNAGKR